MITPKHFYEGGMILFNINSAYRYEYELAEMIKRRVAKYTPDGWYRLGTQMEDQYIKRKSHYSESDYWVIPGDPLIYIPDCPKWLLLKSRHIHTLRLQALKHFRRTRNSKYAIRIARQISK